MLRCDSLVHGIEKNVVARRNVPGKDKNHSITFNCVFIGENINKLCGSNRVGWGERGGPHYYPYSLLSSPRGCTPNPLLIKALFGCRVKSLTKYALLCSAFVVDYIIISFILFSTIFQLLILLYILPQTYTHITHKLTAWGCSWTFTWNDRLYDTNTGLGAREMGEKEIYENRTNYTNKWSSVLIIL